MIKDDKELLITKDRLADFSRALFELEKREDIDPVLKEVQCKTIRSEISIFKRDISLFETGEAFNPYGRNECVFQYCPVPELCKANQKCLN